MKCLRIFIVLLLAVVITLLPLGEGRFAITGIASELGLGSRGPEVERIQQSLKNWGYYDGNIDGDFSVKTFMAVRDYQQKRQLPANGIAGKDTQLAMGLSTLTQSGVAYARGNGAGEEQLLARAINGEARGEPYLGQVAVGAVIINRTRDPKFPKTVAGVIYQPGAFTAVSDGQINVAMENNSTVVKAAKDALNGFDPTSGCIYYYNPATATSKWIWSRKVIKKIGKHNFAK